MAESTQEFVVDNEYTLSVITSRTLAAGSSFKERSVITRTFNFLAQQVTTHVRDTALGNSGGYNTGGAGGVANAITQQHFDDFRSDAEIVYMHGKLRDLGGTPPPIEDITRGIGKKPGGLSPASKG